LGSPEIQIIMNTCLITPTYFGDIDQFAILRKTILAFAPQYKHLVIVESEDFSIFNENFGRDKNIEIIKTADILPSEIEQRRKRDSPYKIVRSVKKRLLRKKRHIDGWKAQQFSKIYALASINETRGVFIDSDLFICRNILDTSFSRNGKTKLYCRPAINAESLDFDISTHEIFGNDLHKIRPDELMDYIFQPACFNKKTANILLSKMNELHGLKWHERFLAEKRPSEFNLLGYAASILENLENYEVINCDPEDLHSSLRYQEDRDKTQLELAKFTDQPKDFFLIQSTLKLPINHVHEICRNVFEAIDQQGTPADPLAFASLRQAVG